MALEAATALLKIASKLIMMFGAKDVVEKTRKEAEKKLTEKPKMKTSDKGKDLLAQLEGLRLKPYLDSVNKPTIGIGSTYYEDGTLVTMKDPPITKERAFQLMNNVLVKFEEGIAKLVKAQLNQNQYDALICFSYNVGLGSLEKSTLLKLLNDKKYDLASQEFPKWSKAGGKTLEGLVKRRKAEQELFLKPE